EIGETEPPLTAFADDDTGDQIPADDEEDVDADIATGKEREAGMIEHDRQHRDGTKPIDFRPVRTRSPGPFVTAHRLPRLSDADALPPCHQAIGQVFHLCERGDWQLFSRAMSHPFPLSRQVCTTHEKRTRWMMTPRLNAWTAAPEVTQAFLA